MNEALRDFSFRYVASIDQGIVSLQKVQKPWLFKTPFGPLLKT